MASNRCCSCKSDNTQKESEPDSEPDTEPVGIQTSEACVEDCPKSRGPHPVKRKKYKPDEVSSAGFQCNYALGEDMAPSEHDAIEIQCDFEDDDDLQSICSVCRCSSGFCNPKCEAAKVKMGKNRSECNKSPKTSGIPVAIKRNSAPGLASLIKQPTSSCKCLGRCSRECEKKKLTDAVEVMRAKNASNAANALNATPNKTNTCADNQCRSACNVDTQADMDEPPISPLADVPMDGSQPPNKAKTEASEVCIACQCDGPCNIECLLQKATLIAPEDLVVSKLTSCTVCECTGKCNQVCQEAKDKSKSKDLICETCKCTAECSKECTQKKRGMVGKENQTDKSGPVCHCETMCQAECDQYKQTQTDPDPVAPKTSQAVACELCVCVGACNDNCKIARSAKSTSAQNIAANSTGAICKPCICTKSCNEICEATKNSAKDVCVECVCKATCPPKCEEKKKPAGAGPQRVCEVCTCCGTCTEECELNKLKQRRSSKELRFSESSILPAEAAPEQETADDTTQVNGIIEDFNDNDLIDQASADSPMPNEKAKSSCDFPDAPICEVCECSDPCQTKCAAIRKIKSASDFPPGDMVCDPCACIDKCTHPCELKKKSNTVTCVSEDGTPVICNAEEITDWVPCVTCKDGTPCSPECRERMAQTFCMPPGCGASLSGTQSTEPSEGMETCNIPVQTSCAPLTSCDAQTNDEDEVVGKTTSTSAGLIDDKDLKQSSSGASGSAPTKSADAQSATESKSPCLEGVDPDGTGEQCPGMAQGQRECGMCLKLRSYICKMFQNEDASQQPANQNINESEEVFCTCLAPQPERKSQQKEEKPKPERDSKQAQPSNGDPDGPCKCSRALGRKRSSYTEKMQNAMGRLRTSCDDAELAASPFIKAQSVFTLDVSNQQEAIAALLYKCKQKDQYIDALIDDVLDRSKSKQFNSLLTRLQEQNPNAPDFDSSLISSALDKNSKNDPVCGIDLNGFRVASVKRVGATSLLIKWTQPADGRVCGYDIIVNGQIKAKIGSRERVYAILDALDFSGTISIEVFAMAPTGRAYPAALAYYAKY